MTRTVLRGARIIDPQVGRSGVSDILVDAGRIIDIGLNLPVRDADVHDLSGKILLPGLFDMHVHLCEPGREYKEDIETGARAAVRGGFTDVCCMPDTDPVTDTAAVVEFVKRRAEQVGFCSVHVAGACTKGLRGEVLAEMGDMHEHGAVAFSDGGCSVQDAGMMRRVMDYAKQFGHAVMSHCEDKGLAGDGQVNEGVASTRLGMFGWPAASEEIHILRNIELARLTGCRLHVQHVSTARGLDAIRRAKAEGLDVTCEVTPHHLFLNEDCIGDDYDTNFKVNPPLRTIEDAKALVDGVVDGAVDAIASDHSPHAAYEKAREFELAPFGMIGLETSLSLMITNLVKPGIISWERLVEVMSIAPRRILGLRSQRIEAAAPANFTVVDPEITWQVNRSSLLSKAPNSGFLGVQLTGRATDVYRAGVPLMRDGDLSA